MGFRTAVLVREIWDTRDLLGQVLDESGRVRTESLEGRFDPEDLNALEMALKIKDQHGGSVTALSAGAPRTVDVLRECLYRGADEVLRLYDPSFYELDTLGTARLYTSALSKLDGFDLVLTGIQVVEGETALLGSQGARLLKLASAAYVEEIEDISKGSVTVRRAIEGGVEVVRLQTPCMLSVGVALLKEDPRAPRSAKAKLKLQHKKTPIATWTALDLSLEAGGLSPATQVMGYSPVPQREIVFKRIDGTSPDELRQMFSELKESGALV